MFIYRSCWQMFQYQAISPCSSCGESICSVAQADLLAQPHLLQAPTSSTTSFPVTTQKSVLMPGPMETMLDLLDAPVNQMLR